MDAGSTTVYGLRRRSSVPGVRWPPALQAFVRRCWHQNPKERPTFESALATWTETFTESALARMIACGSARPWFLVASRAPRSSTVVGRSVGITSTGTIESKRQRSKKRFSQLCSEELHLFIEHKAKALKHRGLSELAQLIREEDIDGPEIMSFDERGLQEVGLYEELKSERRRKMKRGALLDLLRSFREEHISRQVVSPKGSHVDDVTTHFASRGEPPSYTYSDEINLKSAKMQRELADVKNRRDKLNLATVQKLRELAELERATVSSSTPASSEKDALENMEKIVVEPTIVDPHVVAESDGDESHVDVSHTEGADCPTNVRLSVSQGSRAPSHRLPPKKPPSSRKPKLVRTLRRRKSSGLALFLRGVGASSASSLEKKPLRSTDPESFEKELDIEKDPVLGVEIYE